MIGMIEKQITVLIPKEQEEQFDKMTNEFKQLIVQGYNISINAEAKQLSLDIISQVYNKRF